jgi:hypothetical protein
MRHIKSCKAGDIICDRTGNKAKVLGRVGSLIFRSEWYRYDIAAFHFISVEEAESLGWLVLLPDGREPITKDEVERLMPNIKIICRKKYGKK